MVKSRLWKQMSGVTIVMAHFEWNADFGIEIKKGEEP